MHAFQQEIHLLPEFTEDHAIHEAYMDRYDYQRYCDYFLDHGCIFKSLSVA